MSESTAVTGWEETQLPANNERFDTSTAVAIAQTGDEIKAAVITAKHFPRDENAAVTKILKSCERAAFAEKATYRFPRGGKTVSGPSVHLAREGGRCWGNLRSGLRIIALTEDEVHIAGWAFDVEHNNFQVMEDRFARKIQRKVGGRTEWIEPDERDLRELINRRGAICERNALLKILPPDVVDLALARVRTTLEKAAKGELEQNREDAIRRLSYAFDKLGVSTQMLEVYLGHALSLVTADEIAEMREVYRSIEDGNSSRDDYFSPTLQTAAPTTSPMHAKLETKRDAEDPLKSSKSNVKD